MGREFVRLSLGGVRDEEIRTQAYLRGALRRVIQSIKGWKK